MTLMPNLGANNTVVKTAKAPRIPPKNYQAGSCGNALKCCQRSVFHQAMTNKKRVPTAKEMRAAIIASSPIDLASWLLIAACVARPSPAKKAISR